MIRDRIEGIENRLERLERPASGTPELTPAEREVRQADIRRQLEQLVVQRALLERESGDPSPGRSVNQHPVSGLNEGLVHDRLCSEIETLMRELRGLEN